MGLTKYNDPDVPLEEQFYTGEGSENLTGSQLKKAKRLQDRGKTKQLDRFLDKKAPNRADDLNKLATEFAMERAADIKSMRADQLAGGGGYEAAELRQLTEGGLAAAQQQEASSLEQEIQQNLNAGMPYAQAKRQARRSQKDVGENAAEIAAKLDRDGWIADKAKKAQDAMKLEKLTTAFMLGYQEDPNAALAGLAAELAGSGVEAVGGVVEEYIGKDWDDSKWALKQEGKA